MMKVHYNLVTLTEELKVQTIRNTKTSQVGLLVKETPKRYKVAYLHKTIKNAHQYAYWKKEDCIVKSYVLDLA